MAPEGAGLAGGEFTERSILASGLEWVSRLLLPAHIVERIRTIVATTEQVGGWLDLIRFGRQIVYRF